MKRDQFLHGQPGRARDSEGFTKERRLEEIPERPHDDADQNLLVFLLDGLLVFVFEEPEAVDAAFALFPLLQHAVVHHRLDQRLLNNRVGNGVVDAQKILDGFVDDRAGPEGKG